ncbi:MAG: hypothetical protein HYZ75_03405 [Elusimicrobia bacterium]|nr:hypothetical protein [Elusimicrobiota bacterium]
MNRYAALSAVALSAAFLAACATAARAGNAVYGQPPEFSGENRLTLSPSQQRMEISARGASVETSGGIGSSGDGGAGGSGGSVATSRPGGFSSPAAPRTASPVPSAGRGSESPSGAENKLDPSQLASAAQQAAQGAKPQSSGGGGSGSGGGGGCPGGSCTKSCALIKSDGDTLAQAARQMQASGDEKLEALGRQVGSFDGERAAALAALRSAKDDMAAARKALDEAASALERFAKENKEAVEKVKKTAESEKKISDEEAKKCSEDREPPRPVSPVTGEAQRTLTLPEQAQAGLTEAGSRLETAGRSNDYARGVSARMGPQATALIAGLNAAQEKLGDVDPGLANVVAKTAKDVSDGSANSDARHGELERARVAVEKALVAARKADVSAKLAATATEAAKQEIDATKTPLQAAATLYAQDAAPAPVGTGATGDPNKGCKAAETQNKAIKAAAAKPVAPVQASVTDAGPAVSEASAARSAVDAVPTTM